eukprot:2881779-Rhodomonas_salina.2
MSRHRLKVTSLDRVHHKWSREIRAGHALRQPRCACEAAKHAREREAGIGVQRERERARERARVSERERKGRREREGVRVRVRGREGASERAREGGLRHGERLRGSGAAPGAPAPPDSHKPSLLSATATKPPVPTLSLFSATATKPPVPTHARNWYQRHRNHLFRANAHTHIGTHPPPSLVNTHTTGTQRQTGRHTRAHRGRQADA